MNLDHLRTFYCVAKAGGVSAGRRLMDYGIELAAVSRQLSALEDDFGVKLCERRPFALTRAGNEVYEYIAPFFDGLPALRKKIRGDAGLRLGVGAPETVLRDYLSEPLNVVRQKFPGLELVLRDGDQADLEELLRRREIDVALAVFDSEPSTGLTAQPLLQLPLALVVRQDSKWKSAEELWKGGCIQEQLLWMSSRSAIRRNFREGLARRGIRFKSATDLETTDLIEAYVRDGFGVGVSVEIPGRKKIKGLRLLSLKDFAPVTFGILRQETPNEQMSAFIETVRAKKF